MFRNLRERTKQVAMPLAAVAAFVLLSLFSLASSSSMHYINKIQGEETSSHSQHRKIHLQKHIQVAESACQGTLYPDLCVSTLSNILPDIHTKSLSQIISAVINHTVGEVRSVEHNCSGIRREFPKLSPLDKRAFEDCHELFDDTVSELKTTISDLSSSEKSISKDDVETLLSGAMTNQYTCLDGFAYSKDNVRDYIEKSIEQISHHVSNSLAMVTKMKKKKKSMSSSSWPEDSRSGEVFPEYGKVKDGFPTWVKRKDRAFLQVDEYKY